MDEIVVRYLHFLQHAERSPATLKNYAADLKAFAHWFISANQEDFCLTRLTPRDLRAYKRYLVEERQHKPNTINRKLAALKGFLGWAEQAGLLPHALMLPKCVPEVKIGPRWLDKNEQHQLLRTLERYANVRDNAIVQILLSTGLRVQELCQIRWQDVFISDRKGLLIVRAGKGSKRREIPLNKDAREAFMRLGYAEHAGQSVLVFQGQRGPLTPRGIQFMLKRYATLAQLDKSLSPHHLRHSFCKNLVNAGIGLEKIAVMAGHENLEITRRYCEPSMQDLQQAVERISEMEM